MSGGEESEDARSDALVLGIGNLLWADEGFGVRCVEALHRQWLPAPGVRLMDGGTQGLYLVHHVTASRRLIVFDAIDFDEAPGTLRVVTGDQVARFMGCRKLSLHQTGFQDVLAAAELLGSVPEKLVLIGVQAEQLDDWGGSLTERVKDQIEPALALARDQLAEWSLPCQPRPLPLADSGLLPPCLTPAGYERHEAAGER